MKDSRCRYTAFCISSNSSQLRAVLQEVYSASPSPLGFHCCWLSAIKSLESEIVSPYYHQYPYCCEQQPQDLHNPFSRINWFCALNDPRGRNYYCPIFTAERTPWLCVCSTPLLSQGCLSSAPHRVAITKLLFPLTLLSPPRETYLGPLPTPWCVACYSQLLLFFFFNLFSPCHLKGTSPPPLLWSSLLLPIHAFSFDHRWLLFAVAWACEPCKGWFSFPLPLSPAVPTSGILAGTPTPSGEGFGTSRVAIPEIQVSGRKGTHCWGPTLGQRKTCMAWGPDSNLQASTSRFFLLMGTLGQASCMTWGPGSNFKASNFQILPSYWWAPGGL